MENFWSGFFDKLEKKDKKIDNVEVDPVAQSQGFTPDTYWRSWP